MLCIDCLRCRRVLVRRKDSVILRDLLDEQGRRCALLCLHCLASLNLLIVVRLRVVRVRFALLTSSSSSSSKRSIALLTSSSKSTCFALRCFALLGFALHCLLIFLALLTSTGKSNKSSKNSSRKCRRVFED